MTQGITSTPLPRTTLSAVGIDADGVRDFLDAAQSGEFDVHSLMLLRHGQVAAEGYAAPYGPESRQLLYSLSKTFTSAAAGIAVAEGLFGYDDLLVDHFPDLAEGASPRARTIRVRDALSMGTGHTIDTYPTAAPLRRDSIRDLFVPGPDGTPGETFAYNQLATYSIARIIEQTSGMALLDFVNDRILKPLGSTEGFWTGDADGLAQGFSGLHLRTSSIASFFQLLADDGVRGGVRLLPAEWIARHRTKQVNNASTDPAAPSNPDWSQGYGWQVWIARHGYRGDGAFGQWGIILPDHDVVIAMTGEQGDMQRLLDLVWRHVLPAIDRPGSPEADARLAADLDAWWLEPVGGDTLLGFEADADDGLGGRLTIADGLLSWTDADGVANTAALGEGEWAVNQWRWPHGALDVALSAARQDEATIVRVMITNSPHSFTWTLRRGAPTQFGWRLDPLHGNDPRRLAIN